MDILAILNSNGFQTLVTFLVGFFAFLLYYKQKNDNKRDASKIVLTELIEYENIVKDIKILTQNKRGQGDSILPEDLKNYNISVSNWNQYKYLFINDFDSNEWVKINNFFEQVGILRKTLATISKTFPQNIQSRMTYIHEQLSRVALQAAENNNGTKDISIDKYEKIAQEFKRLYIYDPTVFRDIYNPTGFFTFIENNLLLIDDGLSVSNIGKKLKIINKKKLLFIL